MSPTLDEYLDRLLAQLVGRQGWTLTPPERPALPTAHEPALLAGLLAELKGILAAVVDPAYLAQHLAFPPEYARFLLRQQQLTGGYTLSVQAAGNMLYLTRQELGFHQEELRAHLADLHQRGRGLVRSQTLLWVYVAELSHLGAAYLCCDQSKQAFGGVVEHEDTNPYMRYPSRDFGWPATHYEGVPLADAQRPDDAPGGPTGLDYPTFLAFLASFVEPTDPPL